MQGLLYQYKMHIRRLEIEDNKEGDRQLVYSLYNIEAKKGLAKALTFITKKEGGRLTFFKFLKKDFEALEEQLAEW